jgi:predicted dinucleotide-binding enzyme
MTCVARSKGSPTRQASETFKEFTGETIMKIGLLGTGHIGRTLVQRLSAAGHDVKVANSRGPDTIGDDILKNGARAVTSAEAVIVTLEFAATGVVCTLEADAA